MKKKIVLILIGCMALGIVTIIGTGAGVVLNNDAARAALGFSIKRDSENYNIFTFEDFESLKGLKIEGQNLDLQIYHGPKYTVTIESQNESNIRRTTENGILELIQTPKDSSKQPPRERVVIVGPNMSNKLEELSLNILAGDIKIQNTNIKNMNIIMISGNFTLDKCDIDLAKFDLLAGNVLLENIKTSALDINMTSGNLDIQGSLHGKTILNMLAGNSNIKTDLPASTYSKSITALAGITTINGEETESTTEDDNKANSLEVSLVGGKLNIDFSKDNK